MVEKFQLLQTAHEVLIDPLKRATYDRTRVTKTKVSPSTPTKNRYNRTPANNNGFSKTTPRTGGSNGSKQAFGHFTTKEPQPPWSARRPPPTSNARSTTSANASAKSAEKEKAEAYFNRFKEKATWSNSTPTSPQKPAAPTPANNAKQQQQQRKAEAQKAAGVKTPERKRAGFGSTFFEGESSEEDTFYSFASNGMGKTGEKKSAGLGTGTKTGGGWSERRTAYSHVFVGVKEDLRSPLKANGPSPTGFASDGFKSPKKENSNPNLNGAPTGANAGGASGDTSETKGFGFKGNVPGQTLFGFGINDQQPQASAAKTNGIKSENINPTPNMNGGFTDKRDPAPETNPFFTGPTRRKTSQTYQTPTPLDQNAIPKTPPPVEERRFASAFSRLNVNNPSPTKTTPTKKEPVVNIDDWAKKFEGFNPFMSPATQKLSEDKNFWSSVPLGHTAAKGASPVGRTKRMGGKTGLSDMDEMKDALPKMGETGQGSGFGGTGGAATNAVPPVFRFPVAGEKKEEGRGVAFQFPVQQKVEVNGFAIPTAPPTTSTAPPVQPAAPVVSVPPVTVYPIPPAIPVVPIFETPNVFPSFEPTTPQRTRQQPTPVTTPLQPAPAAPPFYQGPQQSQPFLQQPQPPQSTIPTLNPPTPPKRLIPRPSKPAEFSFSVPPMAEMQSLAQELQQYHIAYVTERARFDEAWKLYESSLRFWDESSVKKYLELNERISKQRSEMEGLHRLCLERWGAVAKFSGFTG